MSVSKMLKSMVNETLSYVREQNQDYAENFGGYPAPVKWVGNHIVEAEDNEGEITLHVYTPSEFIKHYDYLFEEQ